MPESSEHQQPPQSRINKFISKAKEAFVRKPKTSGDSSNTEGSTNSGEPTTNPKEDVMVRGMSAKGYLDDLHRQIEERQKTYLENQPYYVTKPLEAKDAHQAAFELGMNLSEAVSLWKPKEEIPLADDTILKNYRTILADSQNDKKILYDIQLHYKNNEKGTVPISGGASETKQDPDGVHRTRTFVFQLDPESPSSFFVYYDEYPWHHEDSGKPQRDTENGVINADLLMSRIPRTE